MRDRTWAIEKATKLVAEMTIEEKASQLRFDSPAIDRLHIPEYNWWNEGLHGLARAGTATVFPQAIALAAMFDEEIIKKVAEAISEEARAKYNENIKHNDRDIYKGLTIWSPNVNIFRDPRWGRGHETYGEDPYLTSRLGVAFVEGLQGDGKYLKTAACAKHFAVHSGPEASRHSFDAQVSQKDLHETYLPAFKALVEEADVEAVMGAYNRTNGEPCCANKPLMQDILRKEWKFRGHYVSDCWAIKDFHEHHKVTKTPEESVALALKTGCDVNCGCAYTYLMSAYNKGLINEEDITTACQRLFTTRYLLGMFDKTEFDGIAYERVECEEHVQLALDAARKSCVLLKNKAVAGNKNPILPLNTTKIKTIGVIGPNANSRASLIGNYHGTSSRYITVLEGIQNEVENRASENTSEKIRVLYSEGCAIDGPKTENLAKNNDRISEALTVAEHSDVVILVLGLNENLEGEEGDAGNAYASGDKKDLHLPHSQEILLEKVLAIGKPVTVILMAGSAIDLSFADEKADAILQAWYPGALGGKAVADILFGNCSPSGKLPITFYRNLNNFPEFIDYNMTQRTYRYCDESNVLYPFGYGLTYGDCKVDKLNLTQQPVFNETIDTSIGAKITISVKNYGNTDTEDVLQLYIKLKDENSTKNPSLCAFKRFLLKAGETKNIELEVPASSFAYYGQNGIQYLTKNDADILADFKQPNNRIFQLTKTKIKHLTVRR
jgi:beta-glucosidase